ncbi:sensor histidine kinase [Arthrobacter sp. MYb224]|nr:sensor histidine kinase [Arthrobacter sp. MYb224]PQZ98016.1 sensor histidine kinase [Arthrobacter sp. MYb229]PRB46898.1 sensor histidine kinase [Arthrobacter sp. MYb216]
MWPSPPPPTATNGVIPKAHSPGPGRRVKSSAEEPSHPQRMHRTGRTMHRLSQLLHRQVPSLPPADWERAAPSATALRRDIAVALGFYLLALLMLELVLSLTETGKSAERPLAFALLAALILPLMFRRRWPITMMLISSAAFLIGSSPATATVVMQFCAQLAYFLGLYTAVAWARNRRGLWTAMALVLLSMAVWLVLSFFTSDLYSAANQLLVENPMGSIPEELALPLYSFLINVLFFGGAIFLGLTSWSNSYAKSLVLVQAARIAAQAEELAARAVNAERLRIARELHDVIAHHIASVGVQASAARLVQDRDPAQAIELMRGIESSARSAVAETRSLLGVLREQSPQDPETGNSAARAPEPSLAALPGLLEQNAAHGLHVQLSEDEHAPGFFASLAPGLSLALYRICGEALANVRRHSTARAATLALRSGTDAQGSWVEVEVTDEGAPRPDSAGSGFGLRGIRERAALHHGLVEIGPRTPRGWRTRARLRLPGSPEGN